MKTNIVCMEPENKRPGRRERHNTFHRLAPELFVERFAETLPDFGFDWHISWKRFDLGARLAIVISEQETP